MVDTKSDTRCMKHTTTSHANGRLDTNIEFSQTDGAEGFANANRVNVTLPYGTVLEILPSGQVLVDYGTDTYLVDLLGVVAGIATGQTFAKIKPSVRKLP